MNNNIRPADMRRINTPELAEAFIAGQVAQGRQVYVICPQVEGDADDAEGGIPMENVVDYAETLKSALPADIRVSYLHGRMRPGDKNRIMNQFAEHSIDVLVSTTIILLTKGAIGEMQSAIQAGTIAKSSLDFSGLSAAGFAGMMLPLLLGMVTDQPTYQRINSAKSAKISRVACYLSCLVMIPLALMPAFIGSYGAFK